MLRASCPFVNVPVLSAQATSTRPSASTADRRRTTASWSDRRRATPASPTLASSGKPSGMAASIVVMPIASREARGILRRNPEARTMPPPPIERGKSTRSIRFRRTPRGLCSNSSADKAAAVAPMRVCRPTATTTACPVPVVTSLPSMTVRLASIPPVGALETGTDSPVSAASSTSRPCELNKRASAAMRSPGASSSTSPGTTSLAGIVTL